LKVLAFRGRDGEPACAACTGADPEYACRRCGREDHPFGRFCGRCTLHDRATELLSDHAGRIHPQLQPVFDALLAGPRPQTTLWWFKRSDGPQILRQMALGELAIAHGTFEQLPSNRATNYLRDLLTAAGVLPPYHPPLERITPWLRQILQPLPKETADLLDQYARWHVLRKLRSTPRGGTPTQKAAEGARAQIRGAARLLEWLDSQDIALPSMTQPDAERYVSQHPTRAETVAAFLDWTDRHRLTRGVTLPKRQPAQPQVTVSDEQRWRHVELLLHDDTFRTYTRVAGLFMLLFAQPLTRTLQMRANQITQHDNQRVSVTFDTVQIELPEPLDQLVRDQLGNRGHASYLSSTDTWLFPGGIPGRHLTAENIRSQLVARGIHPNHARKAAMFQLAAEIPTPVLADILGLGRNTAARWGALASRDWSQYTAMRRE
jgi:hypothetical protein